MSIKSDIKKLIPKRKRTSHKGDFGRLLIVSGSRKMVGCAVLASLGALRSGTGLLTLGFPRGLHPTYTKRLTEAMFLPLPETKTGSLSKKSLKEISSFLKGQNVLAMGPGLTWEAETQNLIKSLIKRNTKPFILDADALYPFSKRIKELKKVKVPFIITPHPGEFKRLFGFNSGKTLSERKKAAIKASLACGGVVVLKGDRTIVADSKKIYINKTGNAGLAKGGSGDVLFGMIASFLGQGLKAYDAAKVGVFLHGLAADIAIKKIAKPSLLATDVINHISSAYKKIQ